MKVKELIEALNKCNPELDVYIEDEGAAYDVVEHLNRVHPENSNVCIY